MGERENRFKENKMQSLDGEGSLLATKTESNKDMSIAKDWFQVC